MKGTITRFQSYCENDTFKVNLGNLKNRFQEHDKLYRDDSWISKNNNKTRQMVNTGAKVLSDE